MTQPELIHYADGRTDRMSYPVESTDVIEKGDFLYQGTAGSGKIKVASVATHAHYFAGVALTESANGDTDDVIVLKKCVVEVDVGTATFYSGEAMGFSATNKLTTTANGTSIVAWAWETNSGSTVTRQKVLVDCGVTGYGKHIEQVLE